MTELRSVDPRTLQFNPYNPRRTAVPPGMDAQLLASIRAIGIIQPPFVTSREDGLMVVAGNRRVRAAIEADLPLIDVVVGDADEAADAMRAVVENLVRADMSSVDLWRAIQRLEAQGWNEPGIADALALPLRTVRRLKLLGLLHPPMLDAMAAGSMPNEDQLRTIAAATREEQAQVWKKYRPTKRHPEVSWWEVARALAKRRLPATAAQFDDALAAAHGVVWEEDLFAPQGEDGRTTTNVEGFLGAQTEWLRNNMPRRGVLLALDENGNAQLPKKAERVWGKPGPQDTIGCYVDPRTGRVETVAYRLPAPKSARGHAAAPDAKPRPEVTQKGVAMIGDLRTDALHQTLADGPIEDDTLLGLLVLAFAADNVAVQSDHGAGKEERRAIVRELVTGGVVTGDRDQLRQAARRMLIATLSCRQNRTNSGLIARVAGETVGASVRLPSMATPAFLSCLSRPALEAAADEAELLIALKARHTREKLVKHYADGRYVYPGALFRLTADEEAILATVPDTADLDGDSDTAEFAPDGGDDAADGSTDDNADETADELDEAA